MTEKPCWWIQNEDLRQEMGLPNYTPPRFKDGKYFYEIISDLESEFDCNIMIVNFEPQHGAKWCVRVNRKNIFCIDRTKTENGNVIYETDSKLFEEKVCKEIEM